LPGNDYKTTSNSPEALDSGSSHTHESASPKPPSTREASLCSTSSTPLLPSNQKAQLTFYHSSMSETDQPQSRLPRSRASLPTPIPNLTKKSRGRRVPTKDSTDVDLNQKDTTDCTSVLLRGVGSASIAENTSSGTFVPFTHMKNVCWSLCILMVYLCLIFTIPAFKCTFPLCEKYFNRHDNLLQHLKVHRQANSLSDEHSLSSQEESQNDASIVCA
jgi:hypothetical protein